MSRRVVIEVIGGAVQAVYGPLGLEVVLIDHDNMKAEGLSAKECSAKFVEAAHGLRQLEIT